MALASSSSLTDMPSPEFWRWLQEGKRSNSVLEKSHCSSGGSKINIGTGGVVRQRASLERSEVKLEGVDQVYLVNSHGLLYLLLEIFAFFLLLLLACCGSGLLALVCPRDLNVWPWLSSPALSVAAANCSRLT